MQRFFLETFLYIAFTLSTVVFHFVSYLRNLMSKIRDRTFLSLFYKYILENSLFLMF